MRTSQYSVFVALLTAFITILGIGAASAALPLDAPVSQPFSGTHNGVDLDGNAGDRVNSPVNGVVRLASPHNNPGGYGTYGELVSTTSDGKERVDQLGHVDNLMVAPGDTVTVGQPVAEVGAVEPGSDSSGEHLHWRVTIDGQRVDPMSTLDEPSVPAQPEAEAPAPAPAPEPEPAPMVEETVTVQAGKHDWSGVLDCESKGNWGINTGNGYEGGLQFSPSTWSANGGSGSAANASPEEQIRVAENVLASQGPGAWPVCSQYLTPGTTPVETTALVPAESAQAEAIPAPGPQLPQAQIIPEVLPLDQNDQLQATIDAGIEQAEMWANGTGNPAVEEFVNNAVDQFSNWTNPLNTAPVFEAAPAVVNTNNEWLEPAPMPVPTVDLTQAVDDTATWAKTVAPEAAPMIDQLASQANAFFNQFTMGAPAAL